VAGARLPSARDRARVRGVCRPRSTGGGGGGAASTRSRNSPRADQRPRTPAATPRTNTAPSAAQAQTDPDD
jgi:hypothetical protein